MTVAIDTRRSKLQKTIAGEVFSPNDPGFAEEISGFNLAVSHRPEIAVGIKSAEDALVAIKFAAENHLKIAVQSTGHGAHIPVASGLMISTRRLNGVTIDPARRIANVGAGVRWSSVVSEAAEHGLAPITGSSPMVGVAGYLLGGGIGPLNRSHGYSSDYLEEVTLVTGGGEIVTANRDRRPELLWALRGGKQGFGVVTELVVRLVEMKSLYAGFLMFAEEHIETAFRSWVDWTSNAEPRVTTSAAIIDFPPFEFIPEPFRGRKLLSLRFAFPGPSDEGERFAAPLRAFAPVSMDTISEMPPTEMARIHSEPVDPLPNAVGGRLLTHIDQDFASIVLEEVGAGRRPPVTVFEIRHIGGASHVDVPEGSAAGGRPAEFTIYYVATNPAQFADELPEFAGRLFASIESWVSSEGNINFSGPPISAESFAASWSPETFARLDVIRHECDPHGLFAPVY